MKLPVSAIPAVASKMDVCGVAEDVAGNDSVFRVGHDAFQFAFSKLS